MDRVTRHPLLKDIPLETAVDYAVDFIRLVGIPNEFMEKVAPITINNYRGVLPCDFYEMQQVRLIKPNGAHLPAFRYSTDNFHKSPIKGMSDLTYKIQGECIITSIEKCDIEISYRAIMVDDDGFPLVPDNSSFAKALENYIKKQWFNIQYDLGKLTTGVLEHAEQEYAWAVGQASADLIRPSIDQMQSLSNMWNRLIDTDMHRHGFIDEGRQEHINTH